MTALAPINAFKIRAIEGYTWQLWLEEILVKNKVCTSVHPLRLRPVYSKKSSFSDEYDMLIGDSLGIHVEVKSRSTPKWGPGLPFPYDAVFIEPLAKWESRTNKPDYYVIICRATKDVMVFDTILCNQWVTERGVGGERVISAPLSCADTINELINVGLG